nr:hypothetical protein [Tanacetum cinerariifolium]
MFNDIKLKKKQFLNGPFILDELQWCKRKKKQLLVFKVDFEKAYDSVRSSRGLIILNGSPTEEFQFYKGLKQDDAVFVGQWCESNINTLVYVLECFDRASGLRISMSKSKLMGLHVDSDKVKGAAIKLGCLTFKTLFTYLGSTVGGFMFWIQAWEEKMVLAHKDKGGLGVSSLFSLNKGLMFKWIWKFYTQDMSLWVRVIKAIYGEVGNMYAKGMGRMLVSGDRWIKGDTHKKRFPRVFELELSKEIIVAMKVTQPCLAFSSFVWSVDLDVSEFRRISVASVRQLIDEKTLLEVDFKTRWIKYVPIKVNVLAWKVKSMRFNVSRRACRGARETAFATAANAK